MVRLGKIALVVVCSVMVLPLGYGTGAEEDDEISEMLMTFRELSEKYAEYMNRTGGNATDSVKKEKGKLKAVTTKIINSIYDFIVIGSGSAGSVVATRLAENDEWKVLLLEAGTLENSITRVPLTADLLQMTDYNWKYHMEYQPGFAKGMRNHTIACPSGKALGGSTVIGNNVYSRGNPMDYDLWAAAGNPGWGYQDVLPYFLKSENSSLKHSDFRYHDTDGELSVEDSYQPELVRAFIDAGGELGYKKYIDYNSPDQIGFATMQGTLLHGQRHTAARAFLYREFDSDNLDILVEAFVTKILIDPNTRIAYGVEYVKDGETHRVLAKKEIVLSAGVFNSPQILMLSGVGPEGHLEDLGIEVIKDLPVGEALYDHVAYLGLIFTSERPLSYTSVDLINPLTLRNFMRFGGGPYTSLGGYDGIGFVQTNLAENFNQPEIELALSTSTIGRARRSLYKIRDDVYNAHWGKFSKLNTFTIYPVLLHPRSKGSVKLRSADPYAPPLLYGNYFSDPDNHDIRTITAGIRFIIRMSKTETFDDYGIRYVDNPVPGCELYEHDSDDYWECALRSLSATFYQYTGTNKMGSDEDPDSVVDSDLKVYGIEGLRVADCSVIPVTLGAQMNAPGIMIGEKAAAMIKELWKDIPEF